MFILVKLFFTAGLIVLITDVAKRSNKFGGLIAAMPIIISLAWQACGIQDYEYSEDIMIVK